MWAPQVLLVSVPQRVRRRLAEYIYPFPWLLRGLSGLFFIHRFNKYLQSVFPVLGVLVSAGKQTDVFITLMFSIRLLPDLWPSILSLILVLWFSLITPWAPNLGFSELREVKVHFYLSTHAASSTGVNFQLLRRNPSAPLQSNFPSLVWTKCSRSSKICMWKPNRQCDGVWR